MSQHEDRKEPNEKKPTDVRKKAAQGLAMAGRHSKLGLVADRRQGGQPVQQQYRHFDLSSSHRECTANRRTSRRLESDIIPVLEQSQHRVDFTQLGGSTMHTSRAAGHLAAPQQPAPRYWKKLLFTLEELRCTREA